MSGTVVERRRASLGGELGDVARARHSIGDWLGDWGLSGLTEDVALVASELITNAILHVGGEIDVVVERCGSGVRVRVGDRRPDLMPARRGPPVEERLHDDDLDLLAKSVFEGTTTGRGLLLVDAFADAWGVDVDSSAKVVWAELGTGRSAEARESDEPAPVDQAGVKVSLRAVPVRLVLLSAANLDDLVRELQTTDFGSREPTELASLGGRLVHETSGQREPLRVAARAALHRRQRRIDVDLALPPGQVAVLRRFVSLTDQVESFCRDGILLSEPPTEEVTAFRVWCVEEMDRQERGGAPAACPFPD